MPQFTLNGKYKYIPAGYRKLSYDQLCVLIGEFKPGDGNVVTVNWFNRKTKVGGTLTHDSEALPIKKNLVVTAVRTDRA